MSSQKPNSTGCDETMTDRLTASIRLHPRTRDILEGMKHGNMTYDDVIMGIVEQIGNLQGTLRVAKYSPGETKGMIILRHMIKKLIDDWLPTHEKNQDYIRRFYYLLGEQAPRWLGDIEPDPWFLRWMDDTYIDGLQLAKEAGEEN